MKKDVLISLAVLVVSASLLCSCYSAKPANASEETPDSDLNSFSESALTDSSLPSSAASFVASSEQSLHSAPSYSVSINSGLQTQSDNTSPNYETEDSNPEAHDASSAVSADTPLPDTSDISNPDKAGAVLYRYYRNAFERTAAMKSYDITTAEQYSCPSYGLDKTVLFNERFESATKTFSYNFYERLYGTPSSTLVWGKKGSTAYVSSPDGRFTTPSDKIVINIPRFFELDSGDITQAKLTVYKSYTGIVFAINNEELLRELESRWSKTVSGGMADYIVKASGLTVSANINNSGYLISETMKYTVTAYDNFGSTENGVLTAEQCTQYAPPEKLREPERFSFVDSLTE